CTDVGGSLRAEHLRITWNGGPMPRWLLAWQCDVELHHVDYEVVTDVEPEPLADSAFIDVRGFNAHFVASHLHLTTPHRQHLLSAIDTASVRVSDSALVARHHPHAVRLHAVDQG